MSNYTLMRQIQTSCNFTCSRCKHCQYDKNICKAINLLFNTAKAQNEHSKCFKAHKKQTSKIEYSSRAIKKINCICTALNMDESLKSISFYLSQPFLIVDPYFKASLEYRDYTADYSYICKYKAELKKLNINENSTIETILKKLVSDDDFYSYKKEHLEIYAKAIKYFLTQRTFTLTNKKTRKKEITPPINWYRIVYNYSLKQYRGYDLKFLSSFCKSESISRNIAENLLNILNYKECFSFFDLKYIKEYLITNYKLKITDNDFFDILKKISCLK